MKPKRAMIISLLFLKKHFNPRCMNKYFNRSSILLFIIIFSFIHCKKQNNSEVAFTIESKDDETINSSLNIDKKLIIKKILKEEKINGVFTEILALDSLLICGNLRSSKLLNIYSLKSGKLLNQIINRDTGENEGLSIAGFTHELNNPNIIWAYDITLGKLFEVEIPNAIKDSLYSPKNEINLTGTLKNIVSPQIISNNLFLATTYSLDDCRYLITNGSQIISKYGALPKINNEDFLKNSSKNKIPNLSYISKAYSIKHPNQNKVAVFYNKFDRVELFENNNIVKIITDRRLAPKMKISKLEDGYKLQDSDDIIYGFFSISYTEDNIFGLYSGGKDFETSSDRVLVFDWQGNLVKEISLDRKVSKISVCSKRNKLYCYEEKENGIFSTDLVFLK